MTLCLTQLTTLVAAVMQLLAVDTPTKPVLCAYLVRLRSAALTVLPFVTQPLRLFDVANKLLPLQVRNGWRWTLQQSRCTVRLV